ncbi:MAG TPA: hypothetical protein DCE65_07350 [Clostridiales bacterium]|nr:hypothetical protein [Clostridiales bacterium]
MRTICKTPVAFLLQQRDVTKKRFRQKNIGGKRIFVVDISLFRFLNTYASVFSRKTFQYAKSLPVFIRNHRRRGGVFSQSRSSA